jgi:hypothetical protein
LITSELTEVDAQVDGTVRSDLNQVNRQGIVSQPSPVIGMPVNRIRRTSISGDAGWPVSAIDTRRVSTFKTDLVTGSFCAFMLNDNRMPIDGKPLVRLPNLDVYIPDCKQSRRIGYRLSFKHAEVWFD